MYNNIGKKIRGLAILLAWIGVIVSCVCAFSFFYTHYKSYEMVIAGLITAGIIIAGSLVSWFLSWLVYGFGKLISNTTEIVQSLEDIKDRPVSLVNTQKPVEPVQKPMPMQTSGQVQQSGQNEIPLEDFKLPETREEMFQSQLRKLKKDYEMSRITYDEFESGKKKLYSKYK